MILSHSSKVLKHCIKTAIVLNWYPSYPVMAIWFWYLVQTITAYSYSKLLHEPLRAYLKFAPDSTNTVGSVHQPIQHL